MSQEIDLWRFVAGLGMFLFGMHQMEQGIKSLAGRTFKLFIKKNTKNRIKAILSGTFITSLVQSSSVVSLMVLAFVGANVISMQSALGVILGSNLGTTFTGWVVATLGFKLNIESFSLPLIGIGSILLVIFHKFKKVLEIGRSLAAFGFLFLGLNFMKSAMELWSVNFDISTFADYGVIVFLLVGFVFTAIIQSSSASMVITLSALNSNIITFPAAAAMVIGSDLGTTITSLIGGMPGLPAKKRVALGQFLFNLITDILAFALLYPLLYLIKHVVGIKDPLIGLVFFHSTFNLLGLLIFVPFLHHFTRFLEKKFTNDQQYVGVYIHNLTGEVPEAAIQALRNEAQYLIKLVIKLNMKALGISSSILPSGFLDRKKETGFRIIPKGFKEDYNRIKKLEGEMFEFYYSIQKETLDHQEAEQLSQLVSSIGHSMHAAKEIKDIFHNLEDFRNSSRSALITLNDKIIALNESFYQRVALLTATEEYNQCFESLAQEMIEIQRTSQTLSNLMTDKPNRRHLKEVDISTVLTVSREIYSAQKSIILALKDFQLDRDKAIQFNELPTYSGL